MDIGTGLLGEGSLRFKWVFGYVFVEFRVYVVSGLLNLLIALNPAMEPII